MQAFTSLTSFAEHASTRSDAENVQGRATSISSHSAAHPIHHPSNTPLSHAYTPSQPHSSPLPHSDPQFSATSATDSQHPSPFTRQDLVSPEERCEEDILHGNQGSDVDFPFDTLLSNLALDQEMRPSAAQALQPVSPSVSDEHTHQQDTGLIAHPPQVGSTTTSYLLSPVHTSTGAPSPGINRDSGESRRQPSDSPTPPVGSTMATGRQETAVPTQIPGQSSLHTPEMSLGSRNSSGERLVAYSAQATLPHSSPVVKVESYGGGETINPESTIRDGSNPPWGTNRFSATHLSPPITSVEYSQNDPNFISLSPPAAEVTRAENGSWMPNTLTGQAGVGPTSRAQINDIYVPSLKEQEEQRQLEEKKANVEQWLVESANPGIPADQPVSVPRLQVRKSVFTSGGRPRARSTGDVAGSSPDPLWIHMGDTPVDNSGIPGPGVLLKVQSDYDEEDNEMDETESNIEEDQDTTPPAPIRLGEVDEKPPTDYFTATPEADPDPSQFIAANPWMDPPSNNGPTETHMQPLSSNAAMMRFKLRADNIETASRVATWGTRRMSDTAVEEELSRERARERTPFKRLSLGRDKDKTKTGGDKSTLLEVKNFLKRKSSDKSVSEHGNDSTRKERVPTLVLPRSPSNSSRLSKPLKVNTGAIIAAATAGQVATLGGGGSFGAKPVTSPSSTWEQAKNAFRRSRSKSDLGRKSDSVEVNAPHLSTLMARVGGPPVAKLASPPRDPELTRPTPIDEDDEDENEEDDSMEGAGVEMDLTVRYIDITPTPEGFRDQVKQLNPRLEPFLVDRVSQEQLRRYKRLIDCKVKHHRTVQTGKCNSNRDYLAQGGAAKILPSKSNQREAGTSATEYRHNTAVPPVEGTDRLGDGSVASAQFPRGVPLPPVKRLPAEFECPLCFKVKKFQKPSDWTKHVHEDVEPFTCTFPDCTEPKSFKRKADWVRHENERHRQLEWWTCSLPDCNHTCYRKDNFVQHLVREHKKPEPKVKTTRAAMRGSTANKMMAGNGSTGVGEGGKPGSSPRVDSNQEEIDKLWKLVDECRRITPKVPRGEPCKFCGNICSSWKKLTVHLAKHMQQISLPVLRLVEQYPVNEENHTSGIGQAISSQIMIGSMPGSTMEQGVTSSSVVPSSSVPTNGARGLGHGYQVSTAQPVPGTTRPSMASYNMQNSQYPASIAFQQRASYPGGNPISAYPRQVAQLGPYGSNQVYVRQPNTVIQGVFIGQQGVSGYPPSNGMTSTISGNQYGASFNSQQQQYVNSTSPSNNGNPAYLYVGGPTGNIPPGSTGGALYVNVNGTGYEGGTFLSNSQPTNHPYQR